MGSCRGVRQSLCRALFACMCLIALAIVLACAPARAFAADYSAITKVDITAEAQTDAALHVVEVRTLTVDSSITQLSWKAFDPRPENTHITVNSMRVGFLNDDGTLISGELVEVPQLIFDAAFRSGSAPKINSCALDKKENMIYCFFPGITAKSTQMVVEYDYTVVNGVQLFKDCAEIDWKYINEAWEVASENVTMRITLPVPSGVEATLGDNVYCWGHGPASGEVSDLQDGTITFTVDKVNADSYAETRILLPLAWISHVTDTTAYANKDSVHFDWALEQEASWSDAARVRAKQADVANSIAAVACVVLVLISMAVSLIAGATRKPRKATRGVFELEVLGLHPALFGRLARWNRRDDADLIATVEHLDRAGVLHVAPDQSDDVLIERVALAEDTSAQPLDALDEQALDLLFTRIGQGASVLRASDIVSFARNNPDEFVAAMASWPEGLDERVKRAHLFDTKTARWARALRWLAGLMVLFALCAYLIGQDAVMAVIFVVGAAVVGAFSYYTKRMTQGGIDLYAEQALLQDTLKNAEPGSLICADAQVAGVVMNRAYLLGVADSAAAALSAPSVEGETVSGAPRCGWFAAGDSPSVADLLQSALDDAFAASQETKRTNDVEVRFFRNLRAKRKKSKS